jgi:GTP-binding protein
VGLGHAFLRQHIAVQVPRHPARHGRHRTTAAVDDYRSLLQELELYDPALLDKPRLIVADRDRRALAEANLRSRSTRKVRKAAILPISAALGEGMEEFRRQIRRGR